MKTRPASAADPAAKTSLDVFRRAFFNGPTIQSIVRLPEGVLVEVNDSFIKVLGFQREEVIGKSPLELNFWVQPERIAIYRAQLLAQGQVRDFEAEVKTKNGSARTVLLCSEVVDIDGTLHSLTSGVDITPRKQAEAAARAAADRLRQSEERFSKAFRANPAVMAITRVSDGKYVSVNEAYAQVSGFTEAEILGATTVELGIFTEAERQKFVERIRSRGFVHDYELPLRTKSGRVRMMLLSTDPVEVDGAPHLLTVGLDITERKEAEAKLRESERQLRESEARVSTVFRASPALVAITRLADGKLVSVNDAFAQITGYSESESLGKTTIELGIYPQNDIRKEFLKRIARDGFVRNHEHLLRRKGGELRTLLLSTETVELDGATHLLTVGLDITERKQVEESLRESERRLRESESRFATAFRASPIIMTIGRMRDARFVEVNDAFLRLYDYSRDEVIGHTGQDLALWVNPTAREEFYAELKKNRSVRNLECALKDRHGRAYAMLLSADIIEIDQDPHVLVFALDITHRKQAEESLRESEQRLREGEARFGTAFRACPVIMTVARLPDARYVEVNDAFTEYYGYTRREAIGRTSNELGLWVNEGARMAFFTELEKSRSLRNVECELRSRDGRVFTMQLSADLIEINREPHLLAFALDVTQRKQAETELKKALEQERELSQLKTDFVSLVSHEFRTPLEIIMSSVDNLDRYHERLPAEKRQQLLRTINKSVRRMSGMMEEVLLLGRLDSGGTDFKLAPLDFSALCHRVCDEMESATNRRCPIALKLDTNTTQARGDEAVLRHILSNLLSNAVKYSEPGTTVKLTVRREGIMAEIRVVDRGCGIPAADQPRLFQAFHRGSNAGQVPGTGLGLLIVRRCVDRHGGEIRFESLEGKGTTFIVRLPLFPLVKTGTKIVRAAKKAVKAKAQKK